MKPAAAAFIGVLLVSPPLAAWNNGQTGNTGTSNAGDCQNPPYATHDWIADHALALLPDPQKAWLTPHRALDLIGTEAPDNKTIRLSCGVPNRGYDDRQLGHSVTWNTAGTMMTKDRPAVRAQEEYDKALVAFGQGKQGHAALFLGAMAHYLGEVSQYGHSWPNENHYSDYESRAAALTPSFNGGTVESAIDADTLVRRTPYTAAMRISHATFAGQGDSLSPPRMDMLFPSKPPEFMRSVGASLNIRVHEIADVLHTFFLNMVEEEDD